MAANRRWLTHEKLDPDVVKAARRITAAVRRFVWYRDDGLCRYCSRDAFHCTFYWRDGTGVLLPAIDHVIPVQQGGTADPNNLVLACAKCNGKKGSRRPNEVRMRLLPVCEAT